MKLSRSLAVILALTFCLAGPAKLVCQDDSAAETYEGEPVYKPGHGIKAPRVTYQPTPEYDDKDRKKKVTGTVVLSVIVTKEGETAGIKVTQSLTPGLDNQAIKAVSRWRFEPATRDGDPVAVRIAVETSFNIR